MGKNDLSTKPYHNYALLKYVCKIKVYILISIETLSNYRPMDKDLHHMEVGGAFKERPREGL